MNFSIKMLIREVLRAVKKLMLKRGLSKYGTVQLREAFKNLPKLVIALLGRHKKLSWLSACFNDVLCFQMLKVDLGTFKLKSVFFAAL
jgi:hypothetical protein